MKKFLVLIFILCAFFAGLSCYDDTDEDCDEAPTPCNSSASQGYLNFDVTSDDSEVTLQNIRLCEGDDYDTGTNCVTLGSTGSQYVDNGEYSAMATYHVNYNGKTYTIEAVDGVDLDYSSDDYCGGVTCYEEGSETFELEFDRDAFMDMLEGTSKECFIATAAYGSGDAWQVEYLRSFRDRVLSKSTAGRFFIREYYAHSPAAAGFISTRPVLQTTVSGILSGLIYAIMHPYLFSASVMAFIAAVIMMVYKLKAQRRRKLTLPGSC